MRFCSRPSRYLRLKIYSISARRLMCLSTHVASWDACYPVSPSCANVCDPRTNFRRLVFFLSEAISVCRCASSLCLPFTDSHHVRCLRSFATASGVGGGGAGFNRTLKSFDLSKIRAKSLEFRTQMFSHSLALFSLCDKWDWLWINVWMWLFSPKKKNTWRLLFGGHTKNFLLWCDF